MTVRHVAALYDIHANLPALEAVLGDVEHVGAELVVVGGDFASGPFPRETLERLAALGERVLFLRGNADREVASGETSVPELAEAVRWCADRLTSKQLAWLARLPETLAVDVGGLGPTLFCHGSPRSDEEIVTRATPEARLAEIVAGVEERVVVCGHTHVQFDRRFGDRRMVNAGSVGMPYEGRPGAYWALLGPGVELRHTDYDLDRAAGLIRASGFPDADELVRENILASPSADEATELFERIAGERAARA